MLSKLKNLILLCLILVSTGLYANEPDSAYVFVYATTKNHNTDGLHYAWSRNQQNWKSIGPEFRFLFCDFGAWGAQKKMISPFMFQDQDSLWHCFWTLNSTVGQFAHADTKDMYQWTTQKYPQVMTNGNVMDIEASWQPKGENYLITWYSEVDGEKEYYKCTTTDFKNYSPTEKAKEEDRLNLRKEVLVDGEKQRGVVRKVDWNTIDELIKYQELSAYKSMQDAEMTVDDPVRFRNLKDLDAELTLYPDQTKEISDKLIGVFFEDINYAADGGLYAELIQNRGFEYDLSDKQGRDSTWTHNKAWELEGKDGSFSIDTVQPIHVNQKYYGVLDIITPGSALINDGFDGIPVKAGDKYDFSVFAKRFSSLKSNLKVQIVDDKGDVIAESVVKNLKDHWEKYQLVLEASKTVANAKMKLIPSASGKYGLDMVSLFPQKTFKGHKNGLRPDLAQAIADLHPKFMRFPGGCVAHGNGLDNIYRWENTVGPLEARKGQRNIWNYHQSVGLGYYEFFQFCEDIGAEPLPVVAAGVCCQNSSVGGDGQQGGIPMCDMGAYVQDVLNLIEWANGDKNTKWGKVRAQAGHPKPFNLKYIGVGNEDLISDIFKVRFEMIYNAIKEKYPDITVIGTVGPNSEGTDYVQGWKFATELGVPMVDEHYYKAPGWFINNQDYYDRYDRSKPKVYLGEYASHLPGRPLNIETGLSEALYLTSVERNGDVVEMTSFAPLLAREHHTQWNPDMIYFNNSEVKLTVDYYVQKMYGNNCGEEYIPGHLKLSTGDQSAVKRVAYSVVKSKDSNDLIVKLVNMLPVNVNSKLDLSAIISGDKDAKLTVLIGDPTDRNAKPVESEITVSGNTAYQLPAYSFSVIRVHLGE